MEYFLAGIIWMALGLWGSWNGYKDIRDHDPERVIGDRDIAFILILSLAGPINILTELATRGGWKK